ncbi:MAG: DUF370 domain-containing protein [Clostridia bacterium]|nr:DUF370 domain-containing protein [Clostridia bacterium]MBQ9921551.1 DUF370 domain-containing protein [Clostridia bacterium]
MRFVNVGFNNMLNADRVVALVSSDAAPSKRLVQDAKDSGRAVDCTCGRKTRCVIITDSDHVILSALQAETVAGRLNGVDGDDDSREDAE